MTSLDNIRYIEIDESPTTPFGFGFKLTTLIAHVTDERLIDRLAETILAKEEEIISKYPVNSDGGSGLGINSLTSRFYHYNIFTWEEDCIQDLKNVIVDAYNVLIHNARYPSEEIVWINGWANVLRETQKFNSHQHNHSLKDSFLSGNLCIQADNTITYYENPHSQEQPLAIENKKGDLTLFQSYIPHGTSSHSGNTARITLAFDLYTDRYKKSIEATSKWPPIVRSVRLI
jgi:Putative 2OG-Fe(II) oxygenase